MKKTYHILFFILILSIFAASFPANKEPASFNLLVITLDTTRADSIGIYGNTETQTPNIDYLGQNGIMFRNCYAPVPLTLPSHCSIFTGRYPIAHQVRNNGTYYLNNRELTLAEIFKSRGFQTSAILSSFTLFAKFGLNQGFDLYDESFNSQNMILNFLSEITADRVYKKFSSWLDHHTGDRFFLWLHFYDPHTPYIPHPEIDPRFDHSNRMKYYGEIAYVDQYIGKVIQDLRSKDLLENTLVVITGDHGEAFGEHGEHGHGIFCYEESLKVPLIFYNRHEFKEERTIDERISLVDIMPTILDIFDFDIPPSVQGINLKRKMEGKKDKLKRSLYFESMDGKEKNNWAPLTGIIEDDRKFISLPVPELYDLKEDFLEKNNIVQADTKTAKELDARLKQFMEDNLEMRPSSRVEPSESDIQRLRSLGYISSFSSSAGRMIDPKKGIFLYAVIEEIRRDIAQGHFEIAEKKFDRLKAQNSDISIPIFYQTAFDIYEKTDRSTESLAVLEKGVEHFPDNEELLIQLAVSNLKRKDWVRTEELCLRLLENNPLFTGAYILLGDMNESMGNNREAVLNYAKAYEIEPQNGLAKAKYIILLIKDDQSVKANSLLREMLKNEDSFINPTRIDIMIDIGVLMAEKVQIEDAIFLLTKITEHSPSRHKAWLNLGTVYQKTGQFDQAIKHYQKALGVNPEYAMAHNHLGMIYLTRFLKNKDSTQRIKALENFNKAIRIDPLIPDAYNGRGVVSLSLEKINDAVLDFKKAIKLKPEYFEAYFNLSIILYQSGRKEEALKYLNQYKEKYYDQINQGKRDVLDRLISDLEK